MKLRNKKTGEIVDAYRVDSLGDNIRINTTGHSYVFESLEKLNSFFEDYKPAEPLIKDEKIRKAVRAWADAIDVDDLFYCIDNRTRRAVFSWPGNDMAMELPAPVEGLETGRVYTITKLCGEEEKW